MSKPRKAASKKFTASNTLPPTGIVSPREGRADADLKAPPDLPVADAFHALRFEAAAVPKDVAVEFQADLTLALHNVRTGVTAVLPHVPRILTELPAIPLAQVLGLPNYVRALIYAESKSATPRKVTGDDIAENLAALQEIRVPALLQLQVFKQKKMADAATVDAIVEGRGTLNFAQDGIDIERVFTENADAWRAKHPFSAEELGRVGALGNWLLDHVQPDGATPRPSPPNEYDLMRRQLWSIVTGLHRHLRTVGIVLWGEEGVDARIPKLQTRHVVARASTDATPPAPAPVDG